MFVWFRCTPLKHVLLYAFRILFSFCFIFYYDNSTAYIYSEPLLLVLYYGSEINDDTLTSDEDECAYTELSDECMFVLRDNEHLVLFAFMCKFSDSQVGYR